MANPDSGSVPTAAADINPAAADVVVANVLATREDASTFAPGAVARGFRVQAAGNIVCVYASGAKTTYSGLMVGDLVEGQFSKFLASGTTITSIKLLW